MTFAESSARLVGGTPQTRSLRCDVAYPNVTDIADAAVYLNQFYAWKGSQPKMDGFKHKAPDQISKDQMEAVRLQREHRVSGEKAEGGLALEQFLNAELPGWFGGKIFRTTLLDDQHGVDAVMELGTQKLAIDYTTTFAIDEIKKKLAKLISGASVNYFRSNIEVDADGKPKEMVLQNIPIVILGIDAKFLPFIAGTVKQREGRAMDSERKIRKDVLPGTFDKHPVEFLIFEQALFQIESQIRAVAATVGTLADQFPMNLKGGTEHDVRSVLARLAFQSSKMNVGEIVSSTQGVLGDLRTFADAHEKDLSIMSKVYAMKKMENLLAIYTQLSEKHADLLKKNTADQQGTAVKWKATSATHRLLVRQAA